MNAGTQGQGDLGGQLKAEQDNREQLGLQEQQLQEGGGPDLAAVRKQIEESDQRIGALKNQMAQNAAVNEANQQALAARQDPGANTGGGNGNSSSSGGEQGGSKMPPQLPQPPQPPQSDKQDQQQAQKPDNNNNGQQNNANNNTGTQTASTDKKPDDVLDLAKVDTKDDSKNSDAEAKMQQDTADALAKIADNGKAQQAALLAQAKVIADARAAAANQGTGGTTPADPGPKTLGDQVTALAQISPPEGGATGGRGNSPVSQALSRNGAGFAVNSGLIVPGGGAGGASAAGGDATPAGAESEIVAMARNRGLAVDGGYGGGGGPGGASAAGGSDAPKEDDAASALLASLLSPQGPPHLESSGGVGTLDATRKPASFGPATAAPNSAAASARNRAAVALAYRKTRNYKMNIVPPKKLQSALTRLQPHILGSTPQHFQRIAR